MGNYSELLKHPKWQRRRLLTFKRDGWRCTKCSNTERELHAHHLYYLDDHAPWEYPDEAIITLCSDCHRLEHIKTYNPESRAPRSIRSVMIDFVKSIKPNG